jgi:putative photosynthetic complex assembly protein
MNAHASSHSHPSPLPRGLLIAMISLVLVSLAGVSAVRLSGVEIRSPDASTVASRSLRFADMPGGGISVIDAQSGQEVQRVQGEGGFLRGALRVMSRERRMRGLGPELPFELLGRADGRLTLVDPATAVRIDLESFGPTNAGAFVGLLSQAHTVSTRSTP